MMGRHSSGSFEKKSEGSQSTTGQADKGQPEVGKARLEREMRFLTKSPGPSDAPQSHAQETISSSPKRRKSEAERLFDALSQKDIPSAPQRRQRLEATQPDSLQMSGGGDPIPRHRDQGAELALQEPEDQKPQTDIIEWVNEKITNRMERYEWTYDRAHERVFKKLEEKPKLWERYQEQIAAQTKKLQIIKSLRPTELRLMARERRKTGTSENLRIANYCDALADFLWQTAQKTPKDEIQARKNLDDLRNILNDAQTVTLGTDTIGSSLKQEINKKYKDKELQ